MKPFNFIWQNLLEIFWRRWGFSSASICTRWCDMCWSDAFPSPWQSYYCLALCLRLSWKCQAVIAHRWKQEDYMLWLLNSKSHSFCFVCLSAVSSPSPSLLVKSRDGTYLFSWVFWMTAPPGSYGVNCCSAAGSRVGGWSGSLSIWSTTGFKEGSAGHLTASNVPHGRASPRFLWESRVWVSLLWKVPAALEQLHIQMKNGQFIPFPPMSHPPLAHMSSMKGVTSERAKSAVGKR